MSWLKKWLNAPCPYDGSKDTHHFVGIFGNAYIGGNELAKYLNLYVTLEQCEVCREVRVKTMTIPQKETMKPKSCDTCKDTKRQPIDCTCGGDPCGCTFFACPSCKDKDAAISFKPSVPLASTNPGGVDSWGPAKSAGVESVMEAFDDKFPRSKHNSGFTFEREEPNGNGADVYDARHAVKAFIRTALQRAREEGRKEACSNKDCPLK